jgi:hypothetical protein
MSLFQSNPQKTSLELGNGGIKKLAYFQSNWILIVEIILKQTTKIKITAYAFKIN